MSDMKDNVVQMSNDCNKNNVEETNRLHPFLLAKITTNVSNCNEVQNLLADFRACGGRYKKKEILDNIQKEAKPEKHSKEKYKLCLDGVPDIFDPSNHQRLAVLFSSFSHDSPNAPAFCVSPRVLFMEFYGRNDIALGRFLEHYCFRSTYKCTSETCNTPMYNHVRRFVHNTGCITISIDSLEKEFSEENIVMWAWCTKCQNVSPSVPMSTDTWSFSFAKYLELKFYADMYTRRGQASCEHSLHHDHYQYYAYKNYVTTFKYTSINLWEIVLPPLIIQIDYNVEKMLNELIDEIRTISQKGHEIFSLIQEKIPALPNCDTEGVSGLKQMLVKEQNEFKQNIEEIQLKLTSPTIENKEFSNKDLHTVYWKISDGLLKVKKQLVEAIETWNLKLTDATRKKGGDKKKDTVDSKPPDEPTDRNVKSQTEETENSSALGKGKIKSFDQMDVPKESSPKSHHRSQSDDTVVSQIEDSVDLKKDTNKISVKNILSQLLPSLSALTLIPSPFSAQEHYTLPSGITVPNLILYESESSSIIAYALNSQEYQKFLEAEAVVRRFECDDITNSPKSKRQSTASEKEDDKNNQGSGDVSSSGVSDSDETSTDKMGSTKKTKNIHPEIQFQDSTCNFSCKIYCAESFCKLRGLVLSGGEEAYVRSLSRSVSWNARGGKSGSNFSKTIDDRFILKEMSKSELQLFLETASNYFIYMHQCYSSESPVPSLLVKIVGMYQITFKNSSNTTIKLNLLVMENLFYKRTISKKFDLKGSLRNRLAVPDNQDGDLVLLDENLIKMTCDDPLYIREHSKIVLNAAIQNDTDFLASQSVIDYSLLVGLDMENNELVLGIIDYIRTFTWDKKLETMVKKSGILGGQGKLPTIISPTEYQKRFIEAMHKYFLEVPDHWAGFLRTK